MRRVCVFCGSSIGNQPAYREAAEAMGALLAERGIGLVYGGGNVGLMGVIADAVLASGGDVIGVIPQSLADREIAHTGITDLRVVDSMHTRKAMMAELSDAFIAMPGGVGTFEEFFEVVTWTQLGLHRKPCGLLNVERVLHAAGGVHRSGGDGRFHQAGPPRRHRRRQRPGETARHARDDRAARRSEVDRSDRNLEGTP